MSTPDTIYARFTRETAEHKMTVLHDDGLYRHLRFMRQYDAARKELVGAASPLGGAA